MMNAEERFIHNLFCSFLYFCAGYLVWTPPISGMVDFILASFCFLASFLHFNDAFPPSTEAQEKDSE